MICLVRKHWTHARSRCEARVVSSSFLFFSWRDLIAYPFDSLTRHVLKICCETRLMQCFVFIVYVVFFVRTNFCALERFPAESVSTFLSDPKCNNVLSRTIVSEIAASCTDKKCSLSLQCRSLQLLRLLPSSTHHTILRREGLVRFSRMNLSMCQRFCNQPESERSRMCPCARCIGSRFVRASERRQIRR